MQNDLTEVEKLKIVKKFFVKVGKGDLSVIACEGTGLCRNLRMYVRKHHFDAYIHHHFIKTWKDFSGDANYPIPSSDRTVPGLEAYLSAESKYTGDYGKKEKSLLATLPGTLKRLFTSFRWRASYEVHSRTCAG